METLIDADVKRKWIEALRSGKYRQARNTLCANSNALCCIGVGAVTIRPDFDAFYLVTDDAAEVLGLSEAQKDSLVDLNDKYGKSFREIADWIEANL